MQRFNVIENKSNSYPVYYVIDLITGQKVHEELHKQTAEQKAHDLNEWHNI